MAFEKVRKAFQSETGIEKILNGLDMVLDGTMQMCDEYEELKKSVKTTHPNYLVYCREQAEVALAVAEALGVYGGITGTVAATRSIDDDFEMLNRRAVATAEKWERELAKFEQRPFDGMDEDSRFAIKPSRELKLYGIEQ
jgi:hypothetical protein